MNPKTCITDKEEPDIVEKLEALCKETKIKWSTIPDSKLDELVAPYNDGAPKEKPKEYRQSTLTKTFVTSSERYTPEIFEKPMTLKESLQWFLSALKEKLWR